MVDILFVLKKVHMGKKNNGVEYFIYSAPFLLIQFKF
jgi:hypothetical protein